MEKNLFLIDRYYQAQEHRLALANQIRKLVEAEENPELIKSYHDRFFAIEKDIAKDLKKSIKDHPMNKWLKNVKGIGDILAASLLSTLDPHKADHASSFWKFCGLDVAPDGRGRGKYKEHLVPKEYKNEDGKIKKTVGITFNPFLKKTCWKIGESFVKQKNSPYREIYSTWKKIYAERDPKLTKLHIHNRAKRKAVKRFLSDLWVEWRGKEGLPVDEPYWHKHQKLSEATIV